MDSLLFRFRQRVSIDRARVRHPANDPLPDTDFVAAELVAMVLEVVDEIEVPEAEFFSISDEFYGDGWVDALAAIREQLLKEI